MFIVVSKLPKCSCCQYCYLLKRCNTQLYFTIQNVFSFFLSFFLFGLAEACSLMSALLIDSFCIVCLRLSNHCIFAIVYNENFCQFVKWVTETLFHKNRISRHYMKWLVSQIDCNVIQYTTHLMIKIDYNDDAFIHSMIYVIWLYVQ